MSETNDNEIVTLKLDQMPEYAKTLMFVITAQEGGNFLNVDKVRAQARYKDSEG